MEVEFPKSLLDKIGKGMVKIIKKEILAEDYGRSRKAGDFVKSWRYKIVDSSIVVWSDYFVSKEEADAEDTEDLEKLADKNSSILEEANRGEIAGLLEASNFVFIGLSSTGDVSTRPALARTLKTGEWYLEKMGSKIFKQAEVKIKDFVTETIANFLFILFQKEADKIFK